MPLVQRQSYCCSFVYCDGTNFCYITQPSLTHNNTPYIVSTKNAHFIKKTFHPLYMLTPPFSIMESRSFTSCIISFLGFLKICLLIFVKVFSWKLGSTIFTPTWFIINLGSAHNKLFTVNLSNMFGLKENLFSYFRRLRSYRKQTTWQQLYLVYDIVLIGLKTPMTVVNYS